MHENFCFRHTRLVNEFLRRAVNETGSLFVMGMFAVRVMDLDLHLRQLSGS